VACGLCQSRSPFQLLSLRTLFASVAASIKLRPAANVQSALSKRAAGTVRVLNFYLVAAELHKLVTVEHHVHGAFHVPALGRSPRALPSPQGLRAAASMASKIFDFESSQHFRFRHVGSKHAPLSSKAPSPHIYATGIEQFRPTR